MTISMTAARLPDMTKKITISLPDEQVEIARRAVASGRAASVSAYISDRLALPDPTEEMLRLLDEMDEEHGPTTAEHEAWARRALGLTE